MHPGTYHDSQAEAERTDLDEHATQRRPLGYTYRTLAERLEREGALRRGDPPNRIATRPTVSRSAAARVGAARLLRDRGPSPWLAALLAALRRGCSPEERARTMGPGNASAVGVPVARTTRFMRLCHRPKKDATRVREAFERKLADLPSPLCLWLTYDQGKAMAGRAQPAAHLKLKVLFDHAHSPWEHATVESPNHCVRHDLPGSCNLPTTPDQKLRCRQNMPKERPRKILRDPSPPGVSVSFPDRTRIRIGP